MFCATNRVCLILVLYYNLTRFTTILCSGQRDTHEHYYNVQSSPQGNNNGRTWSSSWSKSWSSSSSWNSASNLNPSSISKNSPILTSDLNLETEFDSFFKNNPNNNMNKELNWNTEINPSSESKSGVSNLVNQNSRGNQNSPNQPTQINDFAPNRSIQPERSPARISTQNNNFVKKEEEIDDRPIWGLQNIPESKNLARSLDKETRESTTLSSKKETTTLTGIAAAYYDNSVSKRKCRLLCKYPWAVPYVLGGEDANLHEFPHMAALGFGDAVQGRSYDWDSCGGTLISEWFVLTAAHCIDSAKGYPLHVRLGEHDLSQKGEGRANAVEYKIAKVIVHEDYNSNNALYNDIALLKLETKVEITKEIRPACLHNGNAVKEAVATGWGHLGFAESSSEVLQKVSLDIIPNKACQRYLGSDAYIPRGILNTQVCAGILTGGHDTCVGDSGGPIQVNNTMFHGQECPMEIIGITSFGRNCGEVNSPGIYTRVSDFVSWIESYVWPGETVESVNAEEVAD